MLLQPRTSSCTCGKKKTLSEGNLRTDSVKEVEGDVISPQEHQLVLFSFCSDENVICKGPGNTADRKHGFLAQGTNMNATKVIDNGQLWVMPMGCLWGFPSMPATEL